MSGEHELPTASVVRSSHATPARRRGQLFTEAKPAGLHLSKPVRCSDKRSHLYELPRLWRLDEGVLGWGGCTGRCVAFAVALGPPLADAALGPEQATHRLAPKAPRAIPDHAFAPLGVVAGKLSYRGLDGRD